MRSCSHLRKSSGRLESNMVKTEPSLNGEVVKLLCELVQIDSESGEEEEFLHFLADLLDRKLFAGCTFDSYGNLIARLPPKGSSVTQPILFACHGDTVKPGKGIVPIVEGDVVRSKGETILGADDKAGIAEFITALQGAERYPPIEFVVTREEETGLVGARHLDVSQLHAKEGYVLDMDALDAVVVGGPSHVLIDVEIQGKAAHAAMEPEKGVSAILAAARAIVSLPLGQVDPETTANVGIIEGGQIRNGIPDHVTIRAECRSLSHERCMDLAESIEEIFVVTSRAMGAKATVNSELAYRASSISPSARVVTLAKEAIEAVGLTPNVQTIRGGTDAAIYNEHGIETVVIGTGVKAEHSTDEHVYVDDMNRAVWMVRYILEELGSE